MIVVDRKVIRPPVPDGADVGLVRLSPDGSRIAYARFDGSARGIHVCSAEGTGDQRLVAFEDWRAEDLCFSPNGAHLAYVVGGGPPPGGGRAVGWCEAHAPGEIGRVPGAAVAWTPKGNALIVADLGRGALTRQMIASGKNDDIAPLDDDGDPQFAPKIAVSPDGAKIAFTTRKVEAEMCAVWVAVKDDRGISTTLLTEIPGAAAHVWPFWSPKGVTLGMEIVHLEQEKSAIVLVPKLEGEGVLVHENELLDPPEQPAWAPSGNAIAFFGTETPRHEFTKAGPARLFLLDTQTHGKVAITGPDELMGRPRFLDDTHLAVDGGATAHVLTLASAP